MEVLKKLNSRDVNALKDFFVLFYPSLCVFAKKYIVENDVVEDIAQESFLVYWESKKQFDSLDILKGYLYKTVKNKCLNHLKLKGIRNDIINNTFDKKELFYEFVLEEETYYNLYQAIGKLPPQSQRIIELSMRGYKNPEIAEELNVSINTIKTLKRNAYKDLRINVKAHFILLFILN